MAFTPMRGAGGSNGCFVLTLGRDERACLLATCLHWHGRRDWHVLELTTLESTTYEVPTLCTYGVQFKRCWYEYALRRSRLGGPR